MAHKSNNSLTGAATLVHYQSVDTDGDGTGNNADADDDGDGVSDTEDCDSLNPNASEVDCENVCGGNAVCSITQDFNFDAGWNWFSVNVLSDDMSLDSVLGLNWEFGDYIKTSNGFAEFYGQEYGWQGGLSASGIDIKKGYK